MFYRWSSVFFGFFLCAFSVQVSQANVQTFQFKNADHALTFEVLSDDLLHFDYSALNSAPDRSHPLQTTPYINQTTFEGPKYLKSADHGFETLGAQVQVDAATLCFTVFDQFRQEMLTRACPQVGANGNSLTLEQMKVQNIYGLGEQFQTPGVPDGDWMGKIRVPGAKYGNSMVRFGGGGIANAAFPIMYAVGPNSLNYAFYLDTIYPYQWDFTSKTWKIDQTMKGSDPSFRGYFILGGNIPALRKQYMDLVGHPLVPPKKAFGLWVSEYGYRNWDEMNDKLTTLRANHFPIDGFVLDLYWFGGIESDSPTSPMGRLAWDEENFPNPAETVANYDKKDGIGLILIEESYVGSALDNFKSMADRGFFARKCATCEPTVYDAWWGKGAGIDWTNPLAGAAWHDEHRQKLADMGLTFHWTDLGEPENYADFNYYAGPGSVGLTEADAHNIYNFMWHKSIFDGYERNHETKRHFILSRSGAPGLQRFGSAMWSGDIGSNLKSLSAHLDVQMHMSLSGIDYFGADVGGFNRLAVEGDINEVYTKWLAHATLFDVPVRPHADDGSKQNFTAPDRIGDMKSNLFNIRQRYELAPYYYSLAHHAYQAGEPVVPPLVYYYQNDPNVRTLAEEKMIGPDLLAATGAELGLTNRSVYLPAGDWIDYHTQTWYHSAGQSYPGFDLQPGGIFRLPLFARAGAIIPKALVDDQTMNMLGKRIDGSVETGLLVRVFASVKPTEFHLVEDDGVTESYKQGAFADTRISQVETSSNVVVTISPTVGTFDGAPTERQNSVELVLEKKSLTKVLLNGQEISYFDNQDDFDDADAGWTIDAQGVVHAKSPEINVAQAKVFEFQK